MDTSMRHISFFLQYKFSEMNENFHIKVGDFQSKTFKNLLGILLIQCSYPSLTDEFIDRNLVSSFFFKLLWTFLFFSLYYVIVIKYFIRLVETLSCLIILFVIIYQTEILRKMDWIKERVYLFASALQIIIVLPIFLRVSWRKYCLMIVGFQAYFSFRDFDLSKINEMNMYPFLAFFVNSMILVAAHYSSERELKRNFYFAHLFQFSQESCKKILSETISSSAIVINDGDIVFSNEATQNVLPHISKAELKRKLDEIKVMKNHIKEPVNRLSTEMDLLQSFNQGVPRSDEFENLKDVIHYQMSGIFPETPEFNLFRCFLKTGSNDHLGPFWKAFDLRIGYFLWENERALLILLHDTSASSKIQYMKSIGDYKDEIMAATSHNLLRPLNGINVMLEFAAQNLIGKSSERKLVSNSIKSTNVMQYMINELLDYTKIMSGKLILKFETVNLLTTIKEVAKLVKFQAKARNLKFIVTNKTRPGTSLLCNTDESRIKQVLMSLIGNSLKLTTNGFIKVEVTRKSNQEPIIISVEDSGVGIKEKDKGKIFKLFKKPDKTVGDFSKKCRGLSLAVSQSIIKMLNENQGEITFRSHYKQGSIFELPIFSKRSNDDADGRQEIIMTEESPFYNPVRIEEQDSEPASKLFKKQRKRVLIVDDDQMNIKTGVGFFQEIEYLSFDIAFNGQEAIEKILDSKKENIYFDLILMDCNMPVLDGYQASRRIKQMALTKEIPDLKIVALSANVFDHDCLAYKESGMDFFMAKPIDKSELLLLFNKIFPEEECN